jgi:UDP-N-acetylmuramyl pentapeptide phosphotransferase/UDP-N-acetylglucosamine-1-phosphate transferase
VQLVIVIALIAFLVSAFAVAWLAHGRAAQLALDKPNVRSLHTTPIPRTGGLGLLLGIAVSWLIVMPKLSWAWWLALVLIVVVSLIDDLRGLHAGARLIGHLLAATLTALMLLPADTAPWLTAAVILGIGWMCNLYNFMDGSDGLAGGMTLIGFGTYAAAAWLAGSTQFALLNLAVALAAGGFLLHNFYPARIFMGDTGAVTLGFLAATLGIIGWQQCDWTWWFPLLVFSPFIADASITLARRAYSRERVWEAHRDHYYQRLVRLGLGHRGTALAEYALMLTCAAAALWALPQQTSIQLPLLGATVPLYLALAVLISRAWQRRTPDAA